MWRYFCLIIILCRGGIFAQDFQWGIQSSGTGTVEYCSVRHIDNNELLVAANFSNSVDVDPGPGVLNFNSNGFDDVVLLKFNATGNLLWAKRFGGSLMDKVNSMEVDSHHHVVITGFFSGSIDTDPGAGTVVLNSAGVEDIFIIKLDSNGNHIWSRRMGSSNTDIGNDISIGLNDAVIVAGSFVNTVDFDPGAGSFLISSGGLTDGFVEMLDSNGNFVWVRTFGSSNADAVNTVSSNDSGEIYASGYFKGSVDFNPGPGTVNLSSVLSTDDIFILKLNNAGNFQWVKQIGGNSADRGENIIVSQNGSLILNGFFNTSVDFDPGAGSVIRTSNGGDDIFVLQVDSGGIFSWVNTYGGSAMESVGDLTYDGMGIIILTGGFSGTVDFDPGPGTFNLSSTGGTEDVFIQRIQPDGSLSWVVQVGGAGTDKGLSSNIDNNGDLYLSGFFQNTMDADPGTGSLVLNSTSMGDGFLLKFKPCLMYDLSVNQEACDSFIFNGIPYYNSGLYYATFTSIEGCDSTVALNLIINSINTGVNQTGSLLAANQGSATYQWIWCDSMFTPVPGAVGQYFIADTNGIYAVIINDNGCIDTSSCYTVVDVGIDEQATEFTYEVYPNPFIDELNIYSAGQAGQVEVLLYDVTGKLLFKQSVNLNTTFTTLQPLLSSGIYYLEIRKGSLISFHKVLKQ